MSTDAQREALLTQLAAAFLNTVSNRTSLITVTRSMLVQNGTLAMIFVTVFPDTQEKQALDFLKRQRSEFRLYVQKKSRIGRVPFFDFTLDMGEKNRQQIDILSQGK